MDAGAVIERVRQIVAVRGDVDADAAFLESGLVALRELTSWADAQHAVLVGRLASRDSFAAKRIAGGQDIPGGSREERRPIQNARRETSIGRPPR